VSVPSS